MAVSNLTTSISALWQMVVDRLVAAGYPYNRLTTTPTQYLATALTGLTGTAYSNLTTSFSQMLEVLNNFASSDPDLFNETSSDSQLMASIENAFAAGGGGGGADYRGTRVVVLAL